MKATVTIEITDNTSEEELRKAGTNGNEMAYLYRKGFTNLVRQVLHPGCEATINCVVTDNTKPQDREEIDFDYEAEVE